MPQTDSIRVVSKRIKKTLIEKLHIEEEKIIVVPVFVELNHSVGGRILPLADELAGKTVILTMARLVKQKNLPLLVRAFSQVSVKFPLAVLLIIGRGPEKDTIVAEVEKSGLPGKIIFIDWTDDVYSYYELADIYALSSNYEGWGMVVIEAASCGLPIVMTDVGCANEVVKNDESGLIVPIGAEEKLAQALIRLAENRELREKLGAGARQAILNLPDQQKTLELYRDSWFKALKK